MRTLEVPPHDVRSQGSDALLLARTHFALGNDDAARRWYLVVESTRPTLEARSALALLDLKRGLPEALHDLRAMAQEPEANASVLLLLTEAETLAGHPVEALCALAKLSPVAPPNDPAVARQEARVLLAFAPTARALAAARRAVELNPRDWRSVVLLARAMEQAGEGDAARSLLTQALTIFPIVVEVASALFELSAREAPELALRAARECLARAARQGDEPQSPALLEQVLALGGSSPAPTNMLALLLLERGRGTDALGLLLRALRHHPHDASTRLNLALCYARLGRLVFAKAYLEQVPRSAARARLWSALTGERDAEATEVFVQLAA